MTSRRQVLAAAPSLGLAGTAFAQAWPAKPLRYIVPVAAVGGSEVVGRTVCERWAKAPGQTFVVDNLGTMADVRELAALARP